MAERRMFAKAIVESDLFHSMSKDAQLLYFRLGINAYDTGLVINARSESKYLCGSLEPLQELINNKFLCEIEEGNFRIIHWYENNGIGETAKKRNNYTYRKWREAVIKRDGGRCMICGSEENLAVHHIKAFAEYPELRLDINNGITLCKKCHMKLHGLEKKHG